MVVVRGSVMDDIQAIVQRAYTRSRRKYKGDVEPEVIVTRDATLKALAEAKGREIAEERRKMRYARYEKAYRKAMREISEDRVN